MIDVGQYETDHGPTWCPGCGDFAIWQSLKQALATLNIAPHGCVLVFDIGCSGNMADKLRGYSIHGLHGRALPLAEGVKLANHRLPVIVIAGDGGGFGEGLNHFIHTMRGNHDLTYIVHDNAVYGLTKGQTAPTSNKGFKTPSTPTGVVDEPVNPLGLAVAGGATFVARGFAGEPEKLTNLIVQAIEHRGFSFLDVLQPCVTYNHLNTYEWYRKRVYDLANEKYIPTDRRSAYEKAVEAPERLPLGIFYQDQDRPAYHEEVAELSARPLIERPVNQVDLDRLYAEYF